MSLHQATIDRFFARTTETSEESTWICEKCGVVPARESYLLKYIRYSRDFCACQKAQFEAERRAEQWKEWVASQIKYTYAWLGSARLDDTLLAQKTFANFDASYQPDAFEVVRAYAAQPQGTLILYGTYGTGKTHLLAALCNTLREQKKESRFTTAPKLFTAIQNAINTHESYSILLSIAIRTPLLVIDDIDKAKHSDFREEIYFEIIDERTKAGKPTAISTNRLDELASFVGGAVCSRFKIGQIALEMIGKDYREEMNF